MCKHRLARAALARRKADATVLAAVFDSFLNGLSTPARDGVEHAVLDAAVTQVMAVWPQG